MQGRKGRRQIGRQAGRQAHQSGQLRGLTKAFFFLWYSLSLGSHRLGLRWERDERSQAGGSRAPPPPGALSHHSGAVAACRVALFVSCHLVVPAVVPATPRVGRP